MSTRLSRRRRLRGEPGPARPRRPTVKSSNIVAVGFALLPWVSIGFLTPITFVFAAVLRRSWLLGLAAAGYLVAVLSMVTLSDPDPRYGWCIVAALPIGGIHAAIVAPSVARTMRSGRQVDPLTVLANATRDDIAADPVLTAIVERRERRRMAREIVARDPALAEELGIGQPGRDDRFDDGGLIDVNRVDVAVLATLPGFDPNMAMRVVAARDRFEGLRSIADLVVDADVPTDVADHLADRLLFRPLDDVRSDQE
jgi:DNA uptake protein ComE-like DNA-binding protein